MIYILIATESFPCFSGFVAPKDSGRVFNAVDSEYNRREFVDCARSKASISDVGLPHYLLTASWFGGNKDGPRTSLQAPCALYTKAIHFFMKPLHFLLPWAARASIFFHFRACAVALRPDATMAMACWIAKSWFHLTDRPSPKLSINHSMGRLHSWWTNFYQVPEKYKVKTQNKNKNKTI